MTSIIQTTMTPTLKTEHQQADDDVAKEHEERGEEQQEQVEQEDEVVTMEVKRAEQMYGYLLMGAAAVSYTVSNGIVRYAESVHSIPTSATLFVRSATQSVACVILAAFNIPRTRIELRRVACLTGMHKVLLAIRGLFGGLALTLLYESLSYLTIGDATALFFTTPLFTLLLSCVALGEPISMTDMISTALSVTGVVLITLPFSFDSMNKGVAYCLLSAALTAAAYTIVRKLKRVVHFVVFVAAMAAGSTLCALAMGGLVTAWDLTHNHVIVLAWLIVSAAFGLVAQVCVNKALTLCRAAPATLIRNSEVPLSYAVGIAFLGENPAPTRLAGALLIVVSGAIVALSKV